MNQLIAVLQDVDMRLASGTDCRISHNYYSDKLRGGAMAASIGTSTPEDLIESNIHGNRKSTAPSFMFFIPTFELLFVVIRRPTAQSLRAAEPQTG